MHKTEGIFSCKLYQKKGCVRPERPIIDHGRGSSGKRGRNPRKAGRATVWLGAAPLPELLKNRDSAVVTQGFEMPDLQLLEVWK